MHFHHPKRIEIPAAPARVTLAMTTLLTLVTSAKNSREKIPKMSYITALDIWILSCTCEYSAKRWLARFCLLECCFS